MSDLHQKLLLLRDVADGKVWRVVQRSAAYDMDGHTGTRVTQRMRALEVAGWVTLDERLPSARHQRWRLTEAGRAMLDAHPLTGGAP